jgi:hypothetical protein
MIQRNERLSRSLRGEGDPMGSENQQAEEDSKGEANEDSEKQVSQRGSFNLKIANDKLSVLLHAFERATFESNVIHKGFNCKVINNNFFPF